MNDELNWLITVLYGDTLLRCALQVKRDALPGDCAECPMEPENRKAIHALLPLHVQSCGPIVAVEELFEVHIANDGGQRPPARGGISEPPCSAMSCGDGPCQFPGPVMGGRGKCIHCGEIVDNVAYHEANACKRRPNDAAQGRPTKEDGP